ncbi:hypothetical protein [Staphylococcus epidermidis]|uniref:hypothetical protein n=1 Tax=Staphylococcus epidermidis TaxID=1282 RepID=UPI000744144B|nr:hypothetical protein [Staphylococcus epidermidis]CUY02164.1 hypothetical protein SETU_02243 [Staphylococcus epidermidis]
MSQTYYQIKPGNIKGNSEETSSEIENTNHKRDESTDNTNNETLPRFHQKFKSSAKDDWGDSAISESN